MFKKGHKFPFAGFCICLFFTGLGYAVESPAGLEGIAARMAYSISTVLIA